MGLFNNVVSLGHLTAAQVGSLREIKADRDADQGTAE